MKILKKKDWYKDKPFTIMMTPFLLIVSLIAPFLEGPTDANIAQAVAIETEPTISVIIEDTTYEMPTLEKSVEETIFETVSETIPENTMATLPEETKASTIVEEYPNASYIWNYLKKAGYNDYVISGIIGNIMSEVGGGTLKIQAEIYDSSGYFYGICQWSKAYCEDVYGKDLEGQLEYLMKTIKKEYDTFGPAFKTSYQEFCGLQDEKAAAISFARVYERCASFSYGARQSNATTALKYFTN